MTQNERMTKAVASHFAICWAAAVLADSPRRNQILGGMNGFGLVEKGKNGRAKLKLTKLGRAALKKAGVGDSP